jgi:hypothetical protein
MLLSPACQSLYVAISFPWSLAVVIGTFLLLDFYLIRKANRRLRNGHSESSVFVSLSSLKSDDNRADSKGALKYYCISCGAQHKQVSCPKSDSKLQRIEIL